MPSDVTAFRALASAIRELMDWAKSHKGHQYLWNSDKSTLPAELFTLDVHVQRLSHQTGLPLAAGLARKPAGEEGLFTRLPIDRTLDGETIETTDVWLRCMSQFAEMAEARVIEADQAEPGEEPVFFEKIWAARPEFAFLTEDETFQLAAWLEYQPPRSISLSRLLKEKKAGIDTYQREIEAELARIAHLRALLQYNQDKHKRQSESGQTDKPDDQGHSVSAATFERLRDFVCKALDLVCEIHQWAQAAGTDETLATVAGAALHLHQAIVEAQRIWFDTPARRYLERAEPVYLDCRGRSRPDGPTGTCYHDLALVIAVGVLREIEAEEPANVLTGLLRFYTAAGDNAEQVLCNIKTFVSCECQQALSKIPQTANPEANRLKLAIADFLLNRTPPTRFPLGRLQTIFKVSELTGASQNEIAAVLSIMEREGLLWRGGQLCGDQSTLVVDCIEHTPALRTWFADEQSKPGGTEGSGAGANQDRTGGTEGEDDNGQGRGKPPEGNSGKSGYPPEGKKLLQQMDPAVRLAYLAYCYMESKKERRLTDQEAYDLLREEGFPENANELTDYRLPAFDTWGRYLRQARGLTGEQKYTRRRGRPVGKSIVKSEQIERQKDDNE